MIKAILFSLVLYIVFLSRVLFAAGSYEMQQRVYDSIVCWNTQPKPDQCHYLRLGFDVGSQQADLKAYFNCEQTQYGCNYVVSVGGSDGVYLEYSNTYELYLGYDADYISNAPKFYSNMIAVDPLNIAFAGDSSYFPPVQYIFLEFPQVNNPGIGWAGYMLQTASGYIYKVSTSQDLLDILGPFTGQPTPTPTPTPIPTPTQTPTPLPIPTPTPTLEVFPTVTATVVPTNVPVEGGFTYDSATGVGTITVVIKQDVEMVEVPEKVYEMGTETVIDSTIPTLGGSSTTSVLGAVEHYLGQSGDTLDNVKESWFRPLVNVFMGVLFNHPFLAKFQGITFPLSGELCELSVTIYGYDFVIGFCNLESELLILKYVIIGVAGVYATLIVLKGD